MLKKCQSKCQADKHLWIRNNVFYYMVELPRENGKRRYFCKSLHTTNYYEAQEKAKVMAFAFGLSAEIERDLISQRTKEALTVRRANGKGLGRPIGCGNKSHKLDGKMPIIKQMLDCGISKRQIAKRLGVSSPTLYEYICKNKGITLVGC